MTNLIINSDTNNSKAEELDYQRWMREKGAELENEYQLLRDDFYEND